MIQDPLKSTTVPHRRSVLDYFSNIVLSGSVKWQHNWEGQIQVSPKKIREKKVCPEMSGRGKGSEEK